MASKKKKIRCWVCGVPATRSVSSEDHVCDNPVCAQITREHIELTVAAEAVKQKEKMYRKGELGGIEIVMGVK